MCVCVCVIEYLQARRCQFLSGVCAEISRSVCVQPNDAVVVCCGVRCRESAAGKVAVGGSTCVRRRLTENTHHGHSSRTVLIDVNRFKRKSKERKSSPTLNDLTSDSHFEKRRR